MDHAEGLFFAWWHRGILFCAGRRENASRRTGGSFAMSLSVIVITKNEAAVIERCLSSVAWADEIIVFDTDSSDGTADIARRLRARVESDARLARLRRRRKTARWRWRPTGSSLDADEWVTPELRAEIERASSPRPTHSPPTACRAVELLRALSCGIRAGGPTHVTRAVPARRGALLRRPRARTAGGRRRHRHAARTVCARSDPRPRRRHREK